jgi:predicted Fe-Mo cluster-binding NifX family protein
MIIAMPVDDGIPVAQVCPSFGRAPCFCFYDTQEGSIRMLANPAADAEGGAGVKAAQFLADMQTDILITPRGGENAAEVLRAANISVLKAQGREVAENLTAWREGKLAALETFHAGFLHSQ